MTRAPGTGGFRLNRSTCRTTREDFGLVSTLGLPDRMKACLFDLDGVLTQTAKVHAAAWKEMFDTFLEARAQERREAFVSFDPVGDNDAYVDGKPRADGTRSFLAARDIELPEGGPDDPPGSATIAVTQFGDGVYRAPLQGNWHHEPGARIRRVRRNHLRGIAGDPESPTCALNICCTPITLAR